MVGLKEALAQHGIPIEAVGDSQLILGQLKRYAEPLNARLRQLYAEARRLGKSGDGPTTNVSTTKWQVQRPTPRWTPKQAPKCNIQPAEHTT
jgi:hypothetical protein